MDNAVPTLEVGFAIDPSESFGELMQLQQVMDSTEAKIVAEAASIEKATSNMIQLGRSKAELVTMRNAVTRELDAIDRSMKKVESSGEGLVRQFERQSGAFGKSAQEMRLMKAEAAALAAEQQGLTDLAKRIRASESELAGKELAAARRARFEAEALEEARAEAEANAARQATLARVAAEQQLINQLAERERLQAAIERNTGAGRVRATDAGAGYNALAAKFAEDEARATKAAGDAAAVAAREHAALAAAVQASHAAQMADAEAAERLRLATDPLYAATQRLNAEIAESTRLYHAGATAPAEYARQQQVLAGRLDEVSRQHGRLGATGKLAGHDMTNLAFQFQDLGIQMAAAAGSGDPLKMVFMALLQQGSQIYGIMMTAGVGVRAVGAAFLDMSKSILLAVATNPYLLAGAAAITLFAGAVKLLQSAANDGADMKKYAESLGLSAKEIRHLDNVTITFGDTAKAVFQVAGRAIWDAIGPAVTSAWGTMKEWGAWILSTFKVTANYMIGAMVGAYQAIKATWSMLPAAMKDLFYQAVNGAIEAINSLIRKSVEGINAFITAANAVLDKVGLSLPTISAPQIATLKNDAAGAAAKVGDAWRESMKGAIGKDYLGEAGRAIGGAVLDQAAKNARDRLKAQAEKKGYLDPEKGKTDKTAERLAREAEAVEAQIRNLYALADAYKVSGAAALIAEARVKAESDAIKKRGDIEEMVDRQIRVAIAQRVVDAAKSTASMRDQAAAIEQVNAAVAAGTVPAERAADLVKDQLADLPLLAALQAAQQRGLADEAAKATAALDDQRKARERLKLAEETQRFNADMASGKNRLAELQEELRLVGATNAERNITLATLRATQEAEAKFSDPGQRAAYIAQQMQIAMTTEEIAVAQRNYNEALTETADRWAIIAQGVGTAAQAMGDAFGKVGRAIGDVASIFADYHAQRERMEAEHAQRMKERAGDEIGQAREQRMFDLRSSTLQIGAYGDMLSAAKGFFNEKSKGYKAMLAAEKVFRAFQFAMSLKSMVQDVLETGSAILNSTARATAQGAEGIATQSKLPFPLNIAAMAATAAALVAAGIAVMGGGGKNSLPASNSGTGTVLGDSSAKSESITNAINALKDVDTLMLNTSRQMAASLRSIESQIGGFASLLVRQGDSINASDGVAQGFKANGIGSVLGSIPLIGGILKGLFGTKTTVIGSGLFGADQSLGSILGGGFDASYYSDIQKKKKFLGLTTSTKYSTTYTGADAGLENQFTLILRSFNDAILAAAGPLGAGTSEIQQRLNSFVVSIGKIDLKGLTGAEIEEKLNAVFGAAADNMAKAAFPGMEKFQLVGEGLFETLVRVASTVEAVTVSFDMLGQSSAALSVAAKMDLADQFDSVSDFTSAIDGYFQAFYTKEEQAAARTAQLGGVFSSLGMAMPATLAGFRQLVEAQDLTTEAGRAAYATLLQLAPAFADLQSAMDGAKSAADIMTERQDLQRQLLELNGDTAALRALQLAKLDASNRELQQQIWAIQDAKEAAKAADELRQAWSSVGDSIMDEVKRIRGLSDTSGATTYAALLGQFNAATSAARGGDMDAAKLLPQLSQAMLTAAQNAATSRQELERVRAMAAASLETTSGIIATLTGAASTASASSLLDAGAASQVGSTSANDSAGSPLVDQLEELRAELAQLRADNNAGHAANASANGKTAQILDRVAGAAGGDALAVDIAA